MGLLSGLLGNATEIDSKTLERDFASILIEGETIEHAYRLVRDLMVFTDKRLITVDKQGFSGKKKEFVSIPYGSVTRFSKEGKGRFDADAEIKLWLRGEATPMEFSFRNDKNVDDVYRVLSAYVIG